ncbi:MAG: DUF1922 domain-containing protein [Candidatus Thorarchaeota archaeon]
MEKQGWIKDQNPYIVFACVRCKQFLYVKSSQNKKKCLRCGQLHTVASITSIGELVKGMSNAVEMVKKKQNELAIKELGNTPDFRAADSFTTTNKQKPSTVIKLNTKNSGKKDNLAFKFQKMLCKISESYNTFPFYVFEIMAENYAIPLSELKTLVGNAQREGRLIALDKNSFRIRN